MCLQGSSRRRNCSALYYLSLKMKALRFCGMPGTNTGTDTGNTSPKRRELLTERTAHHNASPKRPEPLTERATHRNTCPKRSEPLTERATRGIISKTSGTTHRTNGTRQATHLRRPACSLADGCFRRKKNCETQSCCTCCLCVRDCLMLGKTRGVRKVSVLPRVAGCYRHGQYGRRFQSSGMWHCVTG